MRSDEIDSANTQSDSERCIIDIAHSSFVFRLSLVYLLLAYDYNEMQKSATRKLKII